MPVILVVDDSLADRRLIGSFFERLRGFTVHYANDGADALRELQKRPPHLVLTDLIMPGVNGLELVAAIAKSYPLIPVILVTGKGSEQVAVEALQAGAASYVPKSLLNRLLVETVEKVLAVATEKKYHAHLMDHLLEHDCSFVLDNEIELIAPLVNYLNQCIRRLGVCDEAIGIRVSVALEEALNNALYHGNLELSSAAREGGVKQYREVVKGRLSSPPYRDRKIYVGAKISRVAAAFVVRDEGLGFDPDELPNPTEPQNLEKASGRGLLLMRTFMDEVRFNQQGNEVTMVKHLGRVAHSAARRA